MPPCPPALREAVLHTRAVFDDPAQEFWVLQIGMARHAAGALEPAGAGSPDRCRGLGAGPRVCWPQASGDAMTVLAVYAGRYPDRSSAMQNLQKWPDSLKTYKPLPRSLVRLRAETYPERVPS